MTSSSYGQSGTATAGQPPASSTSATQDAARLLGEAISQVQRVIVGQEHMVEQLMVALLAKGHMSARRRARGGQDPGGAQLRHRGRRRLRAHPVHPGPGALRHRRYPDLQGQPGGFRRRAGPGVRQLHPRRRDQPGPRQGAGRDARADGGEAGVHRGPDLPDAAAVHRDRHPEPDRVRGCLPAARRRSGTASC